MQAKGIITVRGDLAMLLLPKFKFAACRNMADEITQGEGAEGNMCERGSPSASQAQGRDGGSRFGIDFARTPGDALLPVRDRHLLSQSSERRASRMFVHQEAGFGKVAIVQHNSAWRSHARWTHPCLAPDASVGAV